MARTWTIAVVALVIAAAGLTQAGGRPEKDVKIQGKFSKDDPKDQQRGGPAQTHIVKMKAGRAYKIDMVSTELDSYLRLLDSNGTQLEEDDDSGGNLNAQIVFNCTKDGDYKVVCTTFSAEMTGSYTLTVTKTGENQKPSTSHALLIGKTAPDFLGDFAVNGKAVKVSDLKGQVVLLEFWEVRSDACVAVLPQLRALNKAYKGEGLTIVGATFYNSDIGQKVGFDKAAGKIKTLDQADRQTDEATMRAYAEHHKVDHLLMALSKKNALQAFDAYAVNSIPQLVVIDRAGIVRLIHVGDKNSGVVDSEIKKLLAEK